jgi:hypothetical protein
MPEDAHVDTATQPRNMKLNCTHPDINFVVAKLAGPASLTLPMSISDLCSSFGSLALESETVLACAQPQLASRPLAR